jgi:hypothetical protein
MDRIQTEEEEAEAEDDDDSGVVALRTDARATRRRHSLYLYDSDCCL